MPTEEDVTQDTSIKDKSIGKRLAYIQQNIKVEKGQYNKFGGYSYRSKEDILEALKPLCAETDTYIIVDDDIQLMDNGWVYVKSNATLCGYTNVLGVLKFQTIAATGWAREPESKKGMDSSQITGTAASYAGKRALGNLFALDDTKDADAQEPVKEAKKAPANGKFSAHCLSCGTAYTFESREQYEQFLKQPGCCAAPNWAID